MTDALTDIRRTEATIRQTEAEVKAELADLRMNVDSAQKADVDAYAEALAAGAAAPKATASKIKERMRDIEQRVIPGLDESLWLLVPKVREAVKPDVGELYLTKNLMRWDKPDPQRRDQPSPTRHLAHRPRDIVDWVLGRIAAVEATEAKQREKDDIERRKYEATKAVNLAQSEFNIERDREEYESTKDNPTAANARNLALSRGAPRREFDRHAFLEREGLLDDYGYVQPGMSIQTKGGREREVEQVPASEINATNYTGA